MSKSSSVNWSGGTKALPSSPIGNTIEFLSELVLVLSEENCSLESKDRIEPGWNWSSSPRLWTGGMSSPVGLLVLLISLRLFKFLICSSNLEWTWASLIFWAFFSRCSCWMDYALERSRPNPFFMVFWLCWLFICC